MSDAAEHGMLVDGAVDAGIDPDALGRAFALVRGWIDDGVLPGAGVVVARGGRIAGEAYLGERRRGTGAAVDRATVWSLASISKPVTATAVVLLAEDGRFALDEPVHRLVPEFLDAPATAFERRHVTVRHLLSHCSGLPGFSEDNLALREAQQPIEAFVRSHLRQPLFFAPGTFHLYSNCAINVAAEVAGRALAGTLGQRAEIAEVRNLYSFVQERVLGPLGMAATRFRPPPEWDDRIAWVEGTGQEERPYEMGNTAYYRGLGMPWGGLFGTPREIARFADAFLPTAGGVWRLEAPRGAPRRLLGPAAAGAMRRVQVTAPDAPSEIAADLRDGAPPDPLRAAVTWGLGWGVKGPAPGDRTGSFSSPETYFHGGATGTFVWADPAWDLVCCICTNRTLRSGWTSQRPRLTMLADAVLAAVR